MSDAHATDVLAQPGPSNGTHAASHVNEPKKNGSSQNGTSPHNSKLDRALKALRVTPPPGETPMQLDPNAGRSFRKRAAPADAPPAKAPKIESDARPNDDKSESTRHSRVPKDSKAAKERSPSKVKTPTKASAKVQATPLKTPTGKPTGKTPKTPTKASVKTPTKASASKASVSKASASKTSASKTSAGKASSTTKTPSTSKTPAHTPDTPLSDEIPPNLRYTNPGQIPPRPAFGNDPVAAVSQEHTLADGRVTTQDADVEAEIHTDASAWMQYDNLRRHDPESAARVVQTTRFAKAKPPLSFTDHQHYLLGHAAHFSKLMADEKKHHIALARRVAKMVEAYFDKTTGREAREKQLLERHHKALARWTGKRVVLRWQLAVDIILDKIKKQHKREEELRGKQQLDAMLEQSQQVLRRMEYESENEDVGSDDDDQESAQGVSDDESQGDESQDEAQEDESTTRDDHDQSLETDDAAAAAPDTESPASPSESHPTDGSRSPSAYTASEMDIDDSSSVSSVSSQQDTSALLPEFRQEEMTQVPFLFRGSLRHYQREGLDWLVSLYKNRVNGILADEMGLGKTIQTIALLAHLACDHGKWGPHLIVVPTSVMLNWEMEFKRFMPGFKILTYYGSIKERAHKRRGWNTDNAFHVCITSYQLVLADQHIFRRRHWQYLILDEAHNIKSFRSNRWQTLFALNTERRLLLTGTPLQNNLMELWSLMYFLMRRQNVSTDGNGDPAASGRNDTLADLNSVDFQQWFSAPMERAIEQYGTEITPESREMLMKLHTVLRPYILRRTKAEVEKQLPRKTESIIFCSLSRRQRDLYDDFMSRASTRDSLASGQFLSIINALMQLRKVCNHPDLFEERPIMTSWVMNQPIALSYEPEHFLLQKRALLDESPLPLSLQLALGSHTGREINNSLPPHASWSPLANSESSFAREARIRLDPSPLVQELPDPPTLDTNAPSLAEWAAFERARFSYETAARIHSLCRVNSARCAQPAAFGSNLVSFLRDPTPKQRALDGSRSSSFMPPTTLNLGDLLLSTDKRAETMRPMLDQFAILTPPVRAMGLANASLPDLTPPTKDALFDKTDFLSVASVKLTIQFPERRLLQYDCGKLQKLDQLLAECVAGNHRCLIFTQMTKVLDILETFLSFHGYRYLRLDGSTKIENRQRLTERFNNDPSFLCFISSTRSGGLGINLQGADTVIFYDSDWNPALDKQCQDRAHRIGQTRPVRIWRFVTRHTIEENMLRKANEKRILDKMVIQDADFSASNMRSSAPRLNWRDYLDDTQLQELGYSDQNEAPEPSAGEMRSALAAAEDADDADAARAALNETELDAQDFEQRDVVNLGEEGIINTGLATGNDDEDEEESDDDWNDGTVDGYMLRFVDANRDLFNLV